MDKDKLKGIIVNGIKECLTLTVDPSSKDNPDIIYETIADNILAKIPDEIVIAEGEASFSMIFNEEVLYMGLGYQPIYLLKKYIKDNNLIGKSIRLKLEILE
jgi:hypothetical protein